MQRSLLVSGAVLGFLAVALGAFGAHGIEQRIPAARMDNYQTAALYHLAHTFAVLLAGLVTGRDGGRLAASAGWCFVFGVVIFSGSLYLLATSSLWAGTDQPWLGAVTPIGGVALLAGWLLLAVGVGRANYRETRG